MFTQTTAFLFCTLLHPAFARVHFEGNEPFVWTQLGGFRGVYQTVNEKRVAAFLGVPFAQPPIGELRFQKPEPVEHWWHEYCPPKNTGLGELECHGEERDENEWKVPCKGCVLDVIKPANSCMLTPDTNFGEFPGSEMWNPPETSKISEDCLYLNMWVPENPTGDVLVWIFGGGFFSGSPSLDLYNGSVLAAEHSLIVVNINYRLGPFGFLFFGHESPVQGNMGLLDQQLALEWINKYIKAFGGDPKKVTLFGESAGSASVTAHLLASGSHPYFNKIIGLSGALTNLWATRSPETLKKVSFEFAKNLSCVDIEDPSAVLECLKSKSADDILNAGGAMFYLEPPMSFPFVPVDEDKVFFNGNVRDIIEEGKFKKVPAVMGTVNDEGTFWLPYYLKETGFTFDSSLPADADENKALITEEEYLKSMDSFAPYFKEVTEEQWQNLVEAYRNVFPEELPIGERLRNGVGRFLGDFFFTCDLADFANKFVENQEDSVYSYYFNMRSSANPWPEWMGVMHGYEIEYMFGQPFFMPSVYKEELLELEREFSKYIMKLLADFVRDGKPSDDWLPYTTTDRKALVLDKDSMEGNKKYVDLHEEQCQLIKDAHPSPGEPSSTSE
uniref:Carboxylic ester hydrolase n=1 Tax=Dictyocaulus viviparus TaxID=29172 RepID=Q6QDP5_DICVI|nr:secreted acetylcholinesterase [Dictyocaulus viviparus]